MVLLVIGVLVGMVVLPVSTAGASASGTRPFRERGKGIGIIGTIYHLGDPTGVAFYNVPVQGTPIANGTVVSGGEYGVSPYNLPACKKGASNGAPVQGGSFTIAAPDGSTVSGTITGTLCGTETVPLGVTAAKLRFRGTFSITSGTGGYLNATGGGHLGMRFSGATPILGFEVDGSLSLAMHGHITSGP